MKLKGVLIVLSFLFVVALLVHSAEAAGQMGGYVGGGGKFSPGDFGGTQLLTSSREASCSCQPEETTHVKQPPPPPPISDAKSAAGSFYIILFEVFVAISIYCLWEGVKTTLMMVQVAVKNNSAEIDLHFSLCSRIANQWMLDQNGDGSKLSTKGARFMLSETIWRILLHPECCYAATSIVDRKISWKKCFEQICVEQSKKSNGRINEQSIGAQLPEYVVVTVLVATNRDHKLPAINCLADLEKAFSCLKSISGTDIAAVKVFWTDPVGMEELVEEFPQLKPLQSQQPHSTPPAIHFKPPPLPSTQSQCHEGKLVEELQKLNTLMIQQAHPEPLHRRRLHRTSSWS